MTKDNEHARAINRLIRHNYGLGAYQLGEYMVQNHYTGEKLHELYEEQLECLLDDGRLRKYSRTANRLAIILLTAYLMDKCFNLGINLQEIKDVLCDCITQAFTIQDVKKQAHISIHQQILDNPDKFASNQKTYNPSKHLGVYQRNTYGNHELIITTERFEPLLHGVPLDQILNINFEEVVRQPPDRETLAVLKNWRGRGWLNCCNSTQRLYRKLTLGDSPKQQLVYTVIFPPED